MMTSLDDTLLVPTSIEIIGSSGIGVERQEPEQIPATVFDSSSTPPQISRKSRSEEYVYPSDHFGLLAGFEFHGDGNGDDDEVHTSSSSSSSSSSS